MASAVESGWRTRRRAIRSMRGRRGERHGSRRLLRGLRLALGRERGRWIRRPTTRRRPPRAGSASARARRAALDGRGDRRRLGRRLRRRAAAELPLVPRPHRADAGRHVVLRAPSSAARHDETERSFSETRASCIPVPVAHDVVRCRRHGRHAHGPRSARREDGRRPGRALRRARRRAPPGHRRRPSRRRPTSPSSRRRTAPRSRAPQRRPRRAAATSRRRCSASRPRVANANG